MPYVIRFQTCSLGVETEDRTDPVTKMVQAVAVERGLSALEKAAVRERLLSRGSSGPDSLDRSQLYFPGGRTAELTFPNLRGAARCTQGTLVAAEPFRELIELAFDLARLGNLLLFADGVPRPLVPTERQWVTILRRWPSAIVVPTVDRLWSMIAPPEPEAEAESSDAPRVSESEPLSEPPA
jgi:hypothetical protein